jgi:hypothetical protein
MSVKQISAVWQNVNVTGAELALLLALADISDDNGQNIRPSVQYLAWKTGSCQRSVENYMGKWKAMGVLIPVARWNVYTEQRLPLQLQAGGQHKGGRGIVVVYALDLNKFPRKKSWEEYRGFTIKGAELTPFVGAEKGAGCDSKRRTLQQEKAQIAAAHIRKNREVEPGEVAVRPVRAKRQRAGDPRRQGFIDALKKPGITTFQL